MDTRITAEKRERERQVVALMIGIYCHRNHKTRQLCPVCQALADYADARVTHCPHMATKTFCSNCKTHCYKPDMREQIRAVMRFAGPRMIFHHPVMAIQHVIEIKKEQRRMNHEH